MKMMGSFFHFYQPQTLSNKTVKTTFVIFHICGKDVIKQEY